MSVVSKVLEKLVYNSIVDPIPYLSPSLEFYAIIALSSMQLLVFFNIFLSSASQTDVIFLDFRKDFDSVAQSELLFKLWEFGITGNIWFWLRDFLSNRVQYVCVGQSTSPSLPVVLCVPQGSDLPSIFSYSEVLLFADDAKCIMPICSLRDSMV